MRARFASYHERSRGRLYPEADCATRTCFQRDRDRIIHSRGFRRLKHKTQVFVYHEGDYYRTRLTHSLEVAQIARSIARYLKLDEDLAETLALAHDLGHTPFGHTGERALNAAMSDYGGFDHNAQGLRIVTKLEQSYAEFDGLNLSWETLEGLVKHNGPLLGPDGAPAGRYRDRKLPVAVRDYSVLQDLELASHASLEAQVAAVADDIAYNSHDIDDGLRAGLFSLEDIAAVPVVAEIIGQVRGAYPELELNRLIDETVRRLITLMVSDVIAQTTRQLDAHGPLSVEDVRGLEGPLAGFSTGMAVNEQAIKHFLHVHMYGHKKVTDKMDKAAQLVNELFDALTGDPARMPAEWHAGCDGPKGMKTARLVCDFIAGMTDRFAIQMHQKLFGVELLTADR